MQNKSFIVLESVEVLAGEQGCAYLENTPVGVVLLIDLFNFCEGNKYSCVITDADGHTEKFDFSENYIMQKLIDGFDMQGVVYLEIYMDKSLVLRGSKIEVSKKYANSFFGNDGNIGLNASTVREEKGLNQSRMTAREWADSIGETALFNEAENIITKAKQGVYYKDKNEININNPFVTEDNFQRGKEPNLMNKDFELVEDENQADEEFCSVNKGFETAEGESQAGESFCLLKENLQLAEGNFQYAKDNFQAEEGGDYSSKDAFESVAENFQDLSENNVLKGEKNQNKNMLSYANQFSDLKFFKDNSTSVSYFETIKEEFEMLFDLGSPFKLLEKHFGGEWKKVDDGEGMILAKIQLRHKCGEFSNNMPDIVALAMPCVVNKTNAELGKNSVVYKLNDYSDFGYNILFQDARNGKAIKIIENKC